MGVENTYPGMVPSDFNVNWPEGSDDQKYGDDHLRLIKLATYNFYEEYGTYKQTMDALFTGDKIKEAVHSEDSDMLAGKDASQYAEIDGDYPDLRAQSTTKDDVGLGRVENYYPSNSVNDPSTTRYATALAVKVAYDRGSEAINVANSLRNYLAIGSYIFAEEVGRANVIRNPGTAISGSQIRPTGSASFYSGTVAGRKLGHYTADAIPLPGTWMCMGHSVSSTFNSEGSVGNAATLWVRIS